MQMVKGLNIFTEPSVSCHMKMGMGGMYYHGGSL